MNLSSAVPGIPGVVTQLAAASSKMKPGWGPGPTGKFPFRLGWQTILETVRQSIPRVLHRVQLLQPLLTVVPTDLLHWQPVSPIKTPFSLETTHVPGYR